MVRRGSNENFMSKESGREDLLGLKSSAATSHLESVRFRDEALLLNPKSYDGQCPFAHVGCKQQEISKKAKQKHAKSKAQSHALLLLKHVEKLQNHLSFPNRESVISQIRKTVSKTDLTSSRGILLQSKKWIEAAEGRVQSIEVATERCIEDIEVLKGGIHSHPKTVISNYPSSIVSKLDNIESINNTVQIAAEENIKKICILQNKMENNARRSQVVTNKIAAFKMLMIDMMPKDEPKKKESDEQSLLYMNAVLLPNVPGIFHPSPESEDYMPSYEGILLWKISNYHYHAVQAIQGKEQSLYSPIMFTDLLGYKLIACLFLNGNGLGQGSHISVYVSILPGPHDALLAWPFRKKLTFTLIDQNNIEHHVQEYVPEFTDPAFSRPARTMNSLRGFSEFIYREDIYERGFIKDDVLFLRISVEK